MSTREERIAKLKNRTKRGAQERDQKGLGRKSVIDLSKANGTVTKFSIDLEKGKTGLIDLLPFVITQPWYKDLRMKSGTLTGLDIGDWDYKLEIPVHANVGDDNDKIICLQQAFGRKCPLCEDLYAEWDKPDEFQDEKKVNSLKSSWRCFYNVYDYNGQTGGIDLGFDISYKLFEEVLQEATDSDPDGLSTFWDLVEGKSIEFKTREKRLGKNTFHEAHSINFLARDPYDESILKKVHSLDAMLVIPTYERVRNTYLGIDENDEPAGADNESEQAPARRQPRRIGGDAGTTETKTPTGTSQRRRLVDDTKKRGTENDDIPFKCPSDGQFGVDCGNLKECDGCDEKTYDACTAVFAKNDAKKPEEKKAETQPEMPPARRRRTI